MNSLLASYDELIYPFGQRKDWMVSNDIRSRVLLPQKNKVSSWKTKKIENPFR